MPTESSMRYEPCGFSAQKAGFCTRAKGHKKNCNVLPLKDVMFEVKERYTQNPFRKD